MAFFNLCGTFTWQMPRERERDPSCCCQADFDHFLKTASKQELDPSLLIFQWKNGQKLSQILTQCLWHWPCTRYTHSDSWPEWKRAKPPTRVSWIPVSGSKSRPWNQPAAAVLVWLHHREFNYLYTVLLSQQETETVPPQPDPRMMCQHPLRHWKVVNIPRFFKVLTWSEFKSLREG